MKKKPVLFFILFATILIILYFSIPVNNSFTKRITIQTNINAAGRFLYDDSKWIKWWPRDLQNNLATINTKNNGSNYLYSLNKKMYDGINILIKKNGAEFTTTVNFLSMKKDSIVLVWSCQVPPDAAPIAKTRNYFYAKTLEKNAEEILANLKSFLEKNENVYNIKIGRVPVPDTIYIAAIYKSVTYPTTFVIDSFIQQLKIYISLNNARETNPPIFHTEYDDGYFRTIIAVPVDKILPGNKNFLYKRMVGELLVTEVKGGLYTTREALRELEIYMDDNQLSSPAVPFESLITRRQEEPDTSKWVTKVYYPVY